MPCSDLTHTHSWPISGSYTVVIEPCETQCGWCKYKATASNNLRAHARKHIKNPEETALNHITILTGKAGRKKLSVQTQTIFTPQCNHCSDYKTKLRDLENRIQALQSENERLSVALQRVDIKKQSLPEKPTISRETTPSLERTLDNTCIDPGLTMTYMNYPYVVFDRVDSQVVATERAQDNDSERAQDGGSERAQDNDSERAQQGSSAEETLSKDNKCPACDRVFRTPGLQRVHYNRKHNLRYSCQECDKSFVLRADLERHEVSVHQHPRPVSSFFCSRAGCITQGKKFTRRDNFLRHRKVCEERSLRAAMVVDL